MQGRGPRSINVRANAMNETGPIKDAFEASRRSYSGMYATARVGKKRSKNNTRYGQSGRINSRGRSEIGSATN